MIKEAIEKIVSKQDLTYDEAYTVMNEIMNGETTQVQNAAYLAALSTKSTKAETIDEISGSAMAMRDHALKVEHAMDVLDIVGTGGDHAHSINISTTAAMIIAAAGVKVAKHGNRAASSKCGAPPWPPGPRGGPPPPPPSACSPAPTTDATSTRCCRTRA